MKFLIIFSLLPILGGLGHTTEWSVEDSYTLTPSEDPIAVTHRTVKVDLVNSASKIGPMRTTTSNSNMVQTETAEDPILPLILRRFLEDSLNELDSQNISKNDDGKIVKTPLAYMTPPPVPSLSESGQPLSNSSEEISLEDVDVSTTPPSDDANFTTDSSENNSAESTEINENTNNLKNSATKVSDIYEKKESTKKMSQIGEDENKKEDSEEFPQYAQEYQKYWPLKSIKSSNKDIDDKMMDSQEDVESNSQLQSSQPNDSEMDKVIFKDAPESEQFPEHHQTMIQDETPNPNDNQELVESEELAPSSSMPPTLIQPERPIYYLFLRPRPPSSPQYSFGAASLSSPFTNDQQNTLQMYPLLQPQTKISQPYNMQRVSVPVIGSNSAETPNYNYYQYNPYNPYLQHVIRNMIMQMSPNYYSMQTYPGSQTYDYNNNNNNGYGQSAWSTRPMAMLRRPYPYDNYYNYQGNYNFAPPSNDYYGRSMNNIAMTPRFTF